MKSPQEVREESKIQMAPFIFKRIGPVMDHNYYCAVCKKDSAVQEVWWGVLQPCWGCQAEGYKIYRARNWFHRWVLRRLFGEAQP